MNTLYLIAFVIAVIAVFIAVRWVIKHPLNFPNLGRIASGLVVGGATLLDQLNLLPWGKILSDAQAQVVGFAIAAGMMILHVIDMAKAQINPPAPPAP